MKKIVYIFFSIFVLSACTDGFDELNRDPNHPTQVSMSSLLLNAQRSSVRTFLDDNDAIRVLTWAQYTGNTGFKEQVYDYDWNTNNMFNPLCAVLTNFEKLRVQAAENNHVNYEAIAMIMKAWVFANWTDMYGDIPYSEALRGETERLLYPKFDTQESIYKDLVLKLKEAASIIELNKGIADVDGESDVIGQGDMLKWKKFANSLRARLYLRMSEVDGETAKAGLEEIFGDSDNYPVMEENEDNAGFKYIDNSQNQCIFVSQTVKDNNHRVVCATMVDLLCKNNDPRRTIFLNPTENSVDSVASGAWTEYEYSGAPAAVPTPMSAFNRKNISTVGEAISEDWYRPVDIMTFAECMFIKAEAASKGYNVGGSAKNLYEKGIEASMMKWGVSDEGAIADYISIDGIAFDASKAKEQILTQRFIDQFMQGLNTFATLRRGGYPELGFIKIGFPLDYGYPDRLPYAENMVKNSPGYVEAQHTVTQNIWGNVWWATNSEVKTAAIYTKPDVYRFSN